MGSVNDIGMMIASYIMMKASSYLKRDNEPSAVHFWAIISLIVTALFMIGWAITTFNIFVLPSRIKQEYSSTGRTLDFESRDMGSIPFTPANFKIKEKQNEI